METQENRENMDAESAGSEQAAAGETAETDKKDKYEIDMCNGPLAGKILRFYFPLMLANVMQLLFNAADVAVAGHFAGDDALAAVGCTSALTNLLINLFIGLSVGANVLVARYHGAGQDKELKSTVQTAVASALIGGIILIFVGFFAARPALTYMETPGDVLPYSVLYMRIFFAGMPFMMTYNIGAAVLRAVGDTRRPLYYLLIAGTVNVLLNLLFVIEFQMGVAGVATATVISQAISAFLVIRCLIQTQSAYRLVLKGFRIAPDKLGKMVQIGVPAGLQGALFSISNMLIQSSVNSFGKTAMSGNTAAMSIEGFIFTAMNAFHQAAISFCGQNYGARKYKRIAKSLFLCLGFVAAVGLLMGSAALIFADPLLHVYSPKPDVISYGILRMSFICVPYFLCGMMDVMVGGLRGMGYSIMPTVVTLTGACLSRVVWIYTIFQINRTLECLYTSYPISWGLTFLVHFICFAVVYRRLIRRAGNTMRS